MRQLMALNTLWILSNVVFTVFFTIQLAHVLQGYIKPQTTRTWDEYARLEEMEFPLVIKICVIPGFNQKALREFGYEDIFSYFVGRKDSDYYTTYGWAGHTNYTGTVKEVLERVSGYQIEEIIKQIYVWDKKDYKIDIPLKYLKVTRVNYPNNCRSLDLSKVSELNGTNYISCMLKFVSWENIELKYTSVESRLTLAGISGNTTCAQLGMKSF